MLFPVPPRGRSLKIALAAMFLWIVCPRAGFSEVPVAIEVITKGDHSLLAPQQWSRILGESGFRRTTIRSGRPSDEFGIKNIGSKQHPSYLVTALLSGDTLILAPQTRFTQRDLKPLADWLAKLRANGFDTVTQTEVMFGMSAEQLGTIEQGAAAIVTISTLDKSRSEIVASLADNLRHPVVFTGEAKERLAQKSVVRDELRGLSTGTALAAILHPAGLVLVPQSKRGRIRWTIAESRHQKEVWPVGWKSEQPHEKTLPALYQSIQTQVVSLPLQTALDQVAQKIEVPLLFDRSSISSDQIDLKAMVKMQAQRASYKTILTQLLNQVDLNDEVRVDENGKPFLWISSSRR